MKKILFTFAATCLLFGLTPNTAEAEASFTTELADIGGKDKQKKNSHNPYRAARTSAKNANKSTKLLEGQVMTRAKVRNYFHGMFNSKPGKVRNFNSPRVRKRYNRGK